MGVLFALRELLPVTFARRAAQHNVRGKYIREKTIIHAVIDAAIGSSRELERYLLVALYV